LKEVPLNPLPANHLAKDLLQQENASYTHYMHLINGTSDFELLLHLTGKATSHERTTK
jgi:hypothetical protein